MADTKQKPKGATHSTTPSMVPRKASTWRTTTANKERKGRSKNNKQSRTVSARSLKLFRIDSVSLLNEVWSSFLTSVKARTVAVFLWTTCPSRALPLTMQYGTSIFRQRAGSQITIYKEWWEIEGDRETGRWVRGGERKQGNGKTWVWLSSGMKTQILCEKNKRHSELPTRCSKARERIFRN